MTLTITTSRPPIPTTAARANYAIRALSSASIFTLHPTSTCTRAADAALKHRRLTRRSTTPPAAHSTLPWTVAPGNKLTGVPPQQADGELAWTTGRWGGFSTGVEVQYVGKLYVNDRNTDAAPAYTVTNRRAGLAQRAGRATFTEFVRVNNVF